jgi:hypothetical protein
LQSAEAIRRFFVLVDIRTTNSLVSGVAMKSEKRETGGARLAPKITSRAVTQ